MVYNKRQIKNQVKLSTIGNLGNVLILCNVNEFEFMIANEDNEQIRKCQK